MTDRIFSETAARKPFVVMCYPRTGSYLLVDLLNQFPEICCHGEIFKNKHIELPAELKESIGYDVESRNQDPFGYLRSIVEATKDKHTGFKIFGTHSKEVFSWCKTSPEINRVALWRSPFEVYVSLKRATTTGSWTNRNGRKDTAKEKLVFEPAGFDRNINLFSRQNRNLRKMAEAAPDSTYLINYKQVTNAVEIRKLAAFLGATVQPENVEYRLHKQTTERYSDLFANFDELLVHVKAHHPSLRIDPEKI